MAAVLSAAPSTSDPAAKFWLSVGLGVGGVAAPEGSDVVGSAVVGDAVEGSDVVGSAVVGDALGAPGGAEVVGSAVVGDALGNGVEGKLVGGIEVPRTQSTRAWWRPQWTHA